MLVCITSDNACHCSNIEDFVQLPDITEDHPHHCVEQAVYRMLISTRRHDKHQAWQAQFMHSCQLA